MNGATTLPSVSTMSAPKTARMIAAGISQYLFRTRTKSQSSHKREIMASSELLPRGCRRVHHMLSDHSAQLAGQPVADLLGPPRRVVLVVVEVSVFEVHLGGEVETDHGPLPADLQGGAVDPYEGTALIHAIGACARRDAEQLSVMEPVVSAGLGDEDRPRAQALDQRRDAYQPVLVVGEVGLRQIRLRRARGRLASPRRQGEVHLVMAQPCLMGPERSLDGGPQPDEGASLLELPLEPRGVEVVTPRVPDIGVVDADVDEDDARLEPGHIGNPELEIRDNAYRAL